MKEDNETQTVLSSVARKIQRSSIFKNRIPPEHLRSKVSNSPKTGPSAPLLDWSIPGLPVSEWSDRLEPALRKGLQELATNSLSEKRNQSSHAVHQTNCTLLTLRRFLAYGMAHRSPRYDSVLDICSLSPLLLAPIPHHHPSPARPTNYTPTQ